MCAEKGRLGSAAVLGMPNGGTQSGRMQTQWKRGERWNTERAESSRACLVLQGVCVCNMAVRVHILQLSRCYFRHTCHAKVKGTAQHMLAVHAHSL
jgi:hypothetical protein